MKLMALEKSISRLVLLSKRRIYLCPTINQGARAMLLIIYKFILAPTKVKSYSTTQVHTTCIHHDNILSHSSMIQKKTASLAARSAEPLKTKFSENS